MDTPTLNLVYFIKDSVYNPELKYSLRSVETNLRNISVWFVGGKPTGLVPDHCLVFNQRAKTKWANVAHTLREFLYCKDAPEEFILMNDDFFVMKPVDNIRPAFCGSLATLGATIIVKNGFRPSAYTKRLETASEALWSHNLPTLNFELHRPMPIKRDWMRRVYEQFGEDTPCKRSLYGNLFLEAIQPTVAPDCKVTRDTDLVPDSEFLSTEDSSFASGKIGKIIKDAFPNKSRYER